MVLEQEFGKGKIVVVVALVIQMGLYFGHSPSSSNSNDMVEMKDIELMERGTTSSKVKETVLEKEQSISMDISERYVNYSTN